MEEMQLNKGSGSQVCVHKGIIELQKKKNISNWIQIERMELKLEMTN